jgi:hypothetical protein
MLSIYLSRKYSSPQNSWTDYENLGWICQDIGEKRAKVLKIIDRLPKEKIGKVDRFIINLWRASYIQTIEFLAGYIEHSKSGTPTPISILSVRRAMKWQHIPRFPPG